jgi:hypothetical protein
MGASTTEWDYWINENHDDAINPSAFFLLTKEPFSYN